MRVFLVMASYAPIMYGIYQVPEGINPLSYVIHNYGFPSAESIDVIELNYESEIASAAIEDINEKLRNQTTPNIEKIIQARRRRNS